MSGELRQRWEERYLGDARPWDTGVTPPEVWDFWSNQPPARLAVDLGCGTGTNVAYLAHYCDQVIGIELAYNALVQARQRLQAVPRSAGCASLVQADVARLPLAGLAADYVLDIGCLHGIPPDDRPRYAQGVIDNLRTGGCYHLYAFDRVDLDELPERTPSWRGLGPDEVETLFGAALAVTAVVAGTDERKPSRWYLLRKV